jgi:hypothetical protein
MKILLAAATALLLPAPRIGAEPAMPAVFEEFDRICVRPLWPGFEPCGVPLLVFDGQRTWLLRHPAPPAGFTPSERKDALLWAGRHPSVRANTSIELAGVPAASAIFQGKSGSPRSLAGLLVHETFHVFEGRRHPGWSANEADLFLYPVGDAENLALRRLESSSLRRGLAAGHRQGSAAWAARALALRRERFALLPASAKAYERATEMKEGLARYVERVAAEGSEPWIPQDEFPATAVRDRGYASGAAMGLLLDRINPGWKDRLEEKEDITLEELLERAVAGEKPEDLPAREIARERRRAANDVASWVGERAKRRRDFLESGGWRLVVEAEPPLQAERFDPLNVELLTPGEILHTRFVRLASSAGSLEVLGHRCLTVSAGKHPLFEGVRRATIELGEEPRLEETGQAVRISAEGLNLEFRGARVSRDGQTVRLEIPR